MRVPPGACTTIDWASGLALPGEATVREALPMESVVKFSQISLASEAVVIEGSI